MLLVNGPIYTMDPRLPRVRALAVAGERLMGGVDVREGASDAVGHERLDLDGRCVLPAFCDSHVHLRSWAIARTRLDLTVARSRAEALAAVAERAQTDRDPEAWIVGRGWREALWSDGAPDAASLDAASAGRPAALWAHDGHALWLSSEAARRAGLTEGGVLYERAAWAVRLPDPTPLEVSRAVRAAMAEANARGVVAILDLERRGGRGLWQRFDADRRLTLRVAMGVPVEHLAAARALELRSGFGSELLRVGPVKVFMDGTLGSGTAWMLDGGGDVQTTSAELCEIVREAAAGGLAVAVHAIGDGAVRAALDAFEKTRPVWEEALVRPRIEHAQCVDDADLPRFAELGVIASVQPTHLHSDRDVAERAWGPERAARTHRTGDLVRSGAHVALGSDAPVEDLDPLAGIQAAVHRTEGERPPWHAEQRIPVADAILGFTAAGAYATNEERRRGLLLPGYDADLVVLDTDIVEYPERIAETRVVATMLAGRWVHGRPPW